VEYCARVRPLADLPPLWPPQPSAQLCEGSNARELSIGYRLCYERPIRVVERDYRRRYEYIERSNTTALSTISRCIEQLIAALLNVGMGI
jgi:hypothetical protein